MGELGQSDPITQWAASLGTYFSFTGEQQAQAGQFCDCDNTWPLPSVFWSCGNRLPQAWWLNKKILFSHSPRSQESEIKVSAGSWSLLGGRIGSQALPSFRGRWQFPGFQEPHSSLCQNVGVSSYKDTGYDLILTWFTSAKTLFTNEVTFTGNRGEDLNWPSGGIQFNSYWVAAAPRFF